MGVKDFSKTFSYKRTVKLSEYKNKTIAIDAMTEIWRASLGAKSVSALTDINGNPTMHINIVIANVIKWHKFGIKTIWVFDYNCENYDEKFHNPSKLQEIIIRRTKREKANKKINELKNELFHDSDDEQECNNKIEQIKKRTFVVSKDMINDIKFILSCLSIKYITAPKGYEGEHIASLLSKHGIVDAVYSGDSDVIPFGANIALRYHPKTKKILEYTKDHIIEQINADINPNINIDGSPIANNLDINDFRKICAMLGTDMSKRTKGVGPKTIFKKYYSLKLTPDQQLAVREYSKNVDIDLFSKLKVINNKPFSIIDNVKGLILWLVNEKSFNKDRMLKSFRKVVDIKEV